MSNGELVIEISGINRILERRSEEEIVIVEQGLQRLFPNKGEKRRPTRTTNRNYLRKKLFMRR
ncbi:MAG: hypothetical protein ABIE68_02645 [bacterium]